jgi:anti-sigma factor RsiW
MSTDEDTMMNISDSHASADELLLFAYGELPPPRAPEVEAHLAACGACRAQFVELERVRVLADWTLQPRRRRAVRWTTVVLAAAALLAAILLVGRRRSDGPPQAGGWPPQPEWSANAGYVAGGRPMIVIDSQLTRLEQELPHGRP